MSIGWKPMEAYPREDGFGPEVLLLIAPCARWGEHRAVVGRLDADMWLARSPGEPEAHEQILGDPVGWLPLRPVPSKPFTKG